MQHSPSLSQPDLPLRRRTPRSSPMRTACIVCFSLLSAIVSSGRADEEFSRDLLLVGAKSIDSPDEFAIRSMSASGEIGAIQYSTSEFNINSGRLDRSRQQLVMGVSAENVSQCWILRPNGESKYIADIRLSATAWSPDGKQISYTEGSKSYRYNLSSKEKTLIRLPPNYTIDDSHPTKRLNTVLFDNPRNAIYRKFRGDRYPVRQIDLLLEDGKTKPLTKNPSSDNIWSRFSPDGSQIAHLQRIIYNEVPHETLVVCRADGTHPSILVDLRKISFVTRLPWYRAKGCPVWSPDGKTIAWLIDTNKLWAGNDELEVLLVDVESKKYSRHSLTKKGINWVSQIDW